MAQYLRADTIFMNMNSRKLYILLDAPCAEQPVNYICQRADSCNAHFAEDETDTFLNVNRNAKGTYTKKKIN